MEIIIDHRIRDWVFIPLVFVMFMVGILRYYLQRYQNYSKEREKIKSQKTLETNMKNGKIQKNQTFIRNSGLLPNSSYQYRKAFYTKKFLVSEAVQAQNDPMQGLMAMSNPNNMGDMLKNNLSMAVSTMLQYAWVSYFFSGFIIGKVPFPLTQRFRGMLQSGLTIQNLDVKFISSLSLYFLVLFGLSGLQALILGDDSNEMESLNDIGAMRQQMGMGGMGGMPGQTQDHNKLFESEKESLSLHKHTFNGDNIEQTVLRILSKNNQNILI